MSERDMERSTWTRVLSKKQIIRDFALGERRGKISLLKILALTEPMMRSYEGREIVLADAGYCWLQLALDRSHAWFTVMFDEQGRLIQIYVDVTDGNRALIANPRFEDMYLDYVVHGARVYELDRDELDRAFSAGLISRAQYERALAEGEKLFRDLVEHREEIKAFFSARFRELLPELEEA